MVDAKTSSMRLQFVFFELQSLVEELRASAKHPLGKRYYDFFALLLEKKIEIMKKEIEKINYVEID